MRMAGQARQFLIDRLMDSRENSDGSEETDSGRKVINPYNIHVIQGWFIADKPCSIKLRIMRRFFATEFLRWEMGQDGAIIADRRSKVIH